MMQFYKIEARFAKEDAVADSREVQRSFACDMASQSNAFFHKNTENVYVVGVSVRETRMTFAVITKTSQDIDAVFRRFTAYASLAVKSFTTEEITLNAISSLLNSAERNNFVEDDRDILNAFELERISPRYSHRDFFGEAMLEGGKTEAALKDAATELLFSETLCPEVTRIFQGSAYRQTKGHPVQYLVTVDDREVRKAVCRVVCEALYQNNRLGSRRFCFIDIKLSGGNGICSSDYRAMYKSCENGAVVVRMEDEPEDAGEFSRGGEAILDLIADTMTAFKHTVLTVMCFQKNCVKAKDKLLSRVHNMAIVELTEDVAFGDRAQMYLKRKAKDAGVRPDKQLLSAVADSAQGVTAADLNAIFDQWHDQKLRTAVFPQYKDMRTVKEVVAVEKPRGSAYTQLQSLIGLSEAKAMVDQALNFFKVQKLFADRGVSAERPSMHLVFTGNPGTAKTTVARLFAQILKENGVLPRGEMIEVGRAQLVGKYVGHTAPLVQQVFSLARGGVLFIDEAYSLVDGKEGLYGDEAINTIVQEMENHREDTIVIFAGYPDKMEAFLDRNPGLRSRIAFHIPFADYTATELSDIAALIAKNKGKTLTPQASQKLGKVFETARKKADFGNGRFARNVIEKATMAQANRLVSMAVSSVTDSDLTTLCEEDIEYPVPTDTPAKRIGF